MSEKEEDERQESGGEGRWYGESGGEGRWGEWRRGTVVWGRVEERDGGESGGEGRWGEWRRGTVVWVETIFLTAWKPNTSKGASTPL
ncbi:hypothetical protein Pmani_003057 [Petrolisthes manimaculis]|uniref:Uncharacterized protein n=1 Tax=Petrolisthes manimaculis TaxID=1843537 RepID=A0AAE1QGD5_9EUCA|nr:hypothetical protein Pmani_003057 [Petrolisthes manimaculis]